MSVICVILCASWVAYKNRVRRTKRLESGTVDPSESEFEEDLNRIKTKVDGDRMAKGHNRTRSLNESFGLVRRSVAVVAGQENGTG